MSYALAIDGELGETIATMSGWASFTKAVSTPELSSLAEGGVSENIAELKQELESAMGELQDDDLSIAQGLLEALQDVDEDSVVSITDGIGDFSDGEESDAV